MNGPTVGRLPNTLNLTFPGVLGESMLIALDLEGVEVSMGSACAAGAVEPSHVLRAMGRSIADARSSLRISLGWNNTADRNRRCRGDHPGGVAARRRRRASVGGERAMKPRVLVAMSGGVDSSVAAAILREQGYDVVGVAMRLAPEPSAPIAKRRGTCCSHDDFEDARRVAERMDFPFYVIDLRADFAARVVDNFVSDYLGGRTPNPCVMCNREIKFDRLWSRAHALNADYIATGHYARIQRGADGRFHLLRAADEAKDQSYFLFTLGQDELARTIFPLGAMTKTDVRARARALGLATADKPESQEICFVPDGDYASFVERRSDPRATAARLDHRQRRKAAGGSRGSASIYRWTTPRAGDRQWRATIRSRDSGRVGRGRGRAP